MGGLVQPPPAARAHRQRTAGRSRSALLRSEGGTCPSRVIQAKTPPRNPARFTRPETARPRPRTRPTAQAERPACKPARSAPFYRRIRIDAGDRALLAPARGHPGLAPGAALLPAQAGFVQGAPDRIGANLRQPIIRLAQGSLQ